MKNSRMFTFLLFTLLIAGCRSQKAADLIKSKLQIIDMKVHHDSTLNFNEIEPAIIFLENTTGIKSESDGNYIGRYQPTQNDFNRWSSWFEKNRNRLYWDKQQQKVKLK